MINEKDPLLLVNSTTMSMDVSRQRIGLSDILGC